MVNLILPGLFNDAPVSRPTLRSGPVDDLSAGTAAEHLVCADLLLAGYRAYRTDQICTYDVAVEAGGVVVRVQVKATRVPKPIPGYAKRTIAYHWHVRRAGKGGRRVYGADEFDMLALVALDRKLIAYLPVAKARQTVQIRLDNSGGRILNDVRVSRTFADATFEGALTEILLARETRPVIAREAA